MKLLKLNVFILALFFLSCSEDEPTISLPNLSANKDIKNLVFEDDGIEFTTSISTNSIQIIQELPIGTETLNVTEIELSDKASSDIQLGDSVNISTGSNQITVTAEDGSTKNYSLMATFEERTFEVTVYDPVDVSKTNTMPTYAHYMPWFESPEISGYWGSHWTMSNSNPDVIDSQGRRDIASHYYPIIGPYDSADKHYLEYALLTMKLSGLNGVLIDYYGNTQLYDYPENLENTIACIDMVKKVGLDYALVYEDNTAVQGEQNNFGSQKDLVSSHIQFMKQNFFSDIEYVTIDNKPLLLVFGPVSNLRAPLLTLFCAEI